MFTSSPIVICGYVKANHWASIRLYSHKPEEEDQSLRFRDIDPDKELSTFT